MSGPSSSLPDDPIDLSALDPDRDPGSEERFLGAVMTRIAARPSVYPVKMDAFWGAWSLARPVLIAASLIIVLAGVFVTRASNNDPGAPRTVAESLGVPPGFSVSMASAPGGFAP